MTAAITIEGDRVKVVGAGFGDGGKLDLEVRERADNGDSRSARYRLQIAEEDHPLYPAGAVDWDEPLAFGTGTVEVILSAGSDVLATEVFNLGG
jgi:hypothetical protein